MTSVGRPKCLTTLATVIVFPDPVTPSSVWNRSPRTIPSDSSAIARGWSPAGAKGAWRSKDAGGMPEYSTFGISLVGARPLPLLSGQVLPPGDLRDAFHPPRRLHDLLEVGEVLDFHEDGACGPAVDRAQLHAPNIGAGSTHGGRDVGVQPPPIRALERQADDEALPLHLLPVDVQPPLRLMAEHEEIGAVGAVDADAAPPGHVAGHRIAGDRLAALGIAHHEPVDPLDAHPLRSAPHPVDEPLERALF